MRVLNQVTAVTRMNLRSISQRLGPSSVIVIGIAGVVAVLVSILALVSGLTQMMTSTARPDRAIVIGTGASFEILSNLPRTATQVIVSTPGIQHGENGKPLVSVEALATVRVALRDEGFANLSLRGVGLEAFALRPELRLVEGRRFEPAVRELIVGRSAQRQFRGLELGSHITLRGVDWTVVGVFESNGDPREAELMTGAETLQSAFRRSSFQSVAVQLDSTESFDAFKAALTGDPSLSVDVMRESEYSLRQTRTFIRVLSIVAYLVCGIMAVGAVFGALNAMYTAVGGRTVEIATLRVLGFGATPVVISVFAEALLLAVLGGMLGSAVAWLALNGHVVSTSGGGVAQLAVSLDVGARTVALGISWACIIGMIGACLPAIQAARAPLAAALRGN